MTKKNELGLWWKKQGEKDRKKMYEFVLLLRITDLMEKKLNENMEFLNKLGEGKEFLHKFDKRGKK